MRPCRAEKAWPSLVTQEVGHHNALRGVLVLHHAGERPYRVHIDPANDGSEEVSEVADRIRRGFLTCLDLGDLLTAK